MAIKTENPALLSKTIRELAIDMGSASADMVLVGGQSVLFWAEIYGVKQPAEIAALTEDVDFIAGAVDVDDANSAISNKYETKFKIASMDDTSPNSAKMTITVPALGKANKVNVDFLRMITGLETSSVIDNAVEINIDGKSFRIIDPLSLLKSKVSNLGSHLAKRNEEGVAQARMAVEILNKHLSNWISANPDKKPPYQHFEQIIRFARSDPALYARRFHGVDVFDAIPLSSMALDDPFVSIRLPVAKDQLKVKYDKFDAMIERMAEYDNNAASSRFQS